MVSGTGPSARVLGGRSSPSPEDLRCRSSSGLFYPKIRIPRCAGPLAAERRPVVEVDRVTGEPGAGRSLQPSRPRSGHPPRRVTHTNSHGSQLLGQVLPHPHVLQDGQGGSPPHPTQSRLGGSHLSPRNNCGPEGPEFLPPPCTGEAARVRVAGGEPTFTRPNCVKLQLHKGSGSNISSTKQTHFIPAPELSFLAKPFRAYVGH